MTSDDPFADWEALLDDIEVPEAIDYSKMSEIELVQLLNAIDQELMDRKELIRQTTEKGRELHSQRTAIVVVLHTRR